MRQINAGDILDIAMAGTSATLLAKRWESVLLVNVDNETLSRLIANKEAMDALMKIEGFRSLNSDIETIIAKSEKVKKAKKEGTKDLTPKQKKELSDEEKEYKSKRKQIQEKLIKFATRIPVFMYLTDYRERCLKDVITQLEPGLFKKVTGLSVKDFELLVSLGVFNDPLMNDAPARFHPKENCIFLALLCSCPFARYHKTRIEKADWKQKHFQSAYLFVRQISFQLMPGLPQLKGRCTLPPFHKAHHLPTLPMRV